MIARDHLYQMNVKATSKDHGFLFCDSVQSDPAEICDVSFNARLVPSQLTNFCSNTEAIGEKGSSTP